MGYSTLPARDVGIIASIGVLLPLILIIVIACIQGYITRKLATTKGYTGYFWTGFFLQTIGLIYVAGLPLAKDNQTFRTIDHIQN